MFSGVQARKLNFEDEKEANPFSDEEELTGGGSSSLDTAFEVAKVVGELGGKSISLAAQGAVVAAKAGYHASRLTIKGGKALVEGGFALHDYLSQGEEPAPATGSSQEPQRPVARPLTSRPEKLPYDRF